MFGKVKELPVKGDGGLMDLCPDCRDRRGCVCFDIMSGRFIQSIIFEVPL
jgi:hypothetical protein